jgi:hypothetical protein
VNGTATNNPRSVRLIDIATSPMHPSSHKSETIDIAAEIKLLNKDESMLIRETSLGATALFSNSDVDLENAKLNESLINDSDLGCENSDNVDVMRRSVPDLQPTAETENTTFHRTHKRSESEPFIQLE